MRNRLGEIRSGLGGGRPWSRVIRVLAAGSLVWLGHAALTAPAAAQREVTISRESRTSIAVQPIGGSSGGPATSLVSKSLEGSGFFRFAPPGPGVFVAAGTSSGGRIEGSLVDPSGRQLFARSYSGASLKANADRFADDIVYAITGRPGIASGTIAFVSTRTGAKEIHLCDADGGNVRQVTSDGALSVSPSISPDGGSLVHTGYKSGFADVYFIDLLTGARRRIINAPGTNSGAAISPDGRRIALTMSFTGNTELYVTGIGGGKATRLTQTSAVEASPTWSPDGRSLIFTSNASGSPQLYRISASGGAPTPLNVGFGHCTEPDWSPDGQRLAFNALSGGQKVVVYEFSTGRTEVVASGEAPSWGPDSRHLVFSAGGSLVIIDTDSKSTRTIVSGMGRVSEPSWTR